MILASMYMRKIGETHSDGWSNVEIYSSLEEFKNLNEDAPILFPLDSGYGVAKHPRYVFKNGTNIVSVAKKERTVHEYMGYEIVWVAGANQSFEYIEFDSLPRE